MLLYFINDSMDEYAKTSDDFYACLTHIGEDIADSLEESPKKIKFTSEQFIWQWKLTSRGEDQEERIIQLFFSRYGCSKGKDCCACPFACVNCINFYGDYDNDDFRCKSQHLENIDGIDITCMDCNLFQKTSRYPPKIMPKSIQKTLT